MAVTALPTPPTRSDPTNFATRADAYLSALASPFVAEINALQVDVNAKQTSVTEIAATLVTAGDVALASANFKGNWSSLTGAIIIPAVVRHNNSYWMLLQNIADVTTQTPSENSYWTRIKAGHEFDVAALSNGTSTVTWDLAAYPAATLLLNGNKTMAFPTNTRDGTYLLLVTQDTVARTITWNAGYVWPNGVAPDISTVNGKTMFSFVCIGSTMYGGYTPYA